MMLGSYYQASNHPVEQLHPPYYVCACGNIVYLRNSSAPYANMQTLIYPCKIQTILLIQKLVVTVDYVNGRAAAASTTAILHGEHANIPASAVTLERIKNPQQFTIIICS